MGKPIVVSIVGDARGLKSALGESESRLSKFGGSAARFGKVAALGLAAGAAGAVVVGKKLIDAGERMGTANARIQQINDSMGLFGKESQNVSNRLIKLAETQALATGVDQNSIKVTQAKLLTFKNLAKSADVAGGAFDRAQAAAVDMAAAGFGSAETNAVQLGKALEDPIKGITALSRNGITFNAEQKKVIKSLVESGQAGKAQALVLKAIETQVGGTAKATANGTDRMKVGFSQLTERVGAKLVPAVDKAANFFIDKGIPALTKFGQALGPKLTPIIDRVRDALEAARPTITALGETFTTKVLPVVQQVVSFFGAQVVPAVLDLAGSIGTKLRPILTQLGETFTTRILPAFEAARPTLQRLALVIVKVSGFFLKLAAGILGKVLPVVLRLAGFILSKAVPAIAKLIGIVLNIGEKIVSFGKKISEAATKVGNFAKGVVSAIKDIPKKIGKAATVLLAYGKNLISGLINGIKAKAGDLVAAIKNYVVDKIPGPIKKFFGLASPARKVMPEMGKNLVQGLINGVNAEAPTLARTMDNLASGSVRYAGSVPRTRPRLDPSLALVGSGTQINVTLQVPVGGTAEDIGREFAAYLEAYFAVGGKRP